MGILCFTPIGKGKVVAVKETYRCKSSFSLPIEMISKYFLLLATLSFLGWLYEFVLTLIETGQGGDPGALSLPFCPIYGFSLVGMYWLAGTPDNGRGILKRVKNEKILHVFYFLAAFLVPTILELFVGVFFDKMYGIRLWDYSHIPLHYNGYINLVVSSVWAVLIFVFMKFLFMPIKNRVFKMEHETAHALTLVLLVLVILDLYF